MQRKAVILSEIGRSRLSISQSVDDRRPLSPLESPFRGSMCFALGA